MMHCFGCGHALTTAEEQAHLGALWQAIHTAPSAAVRLRPLCARCADPERETVMERIDALLREYFRERGRER